ncbi:Dyp-type peroxidase [Pluteus cervinus]|uniref:Dyp-type peroxidase n=1 Tax=Pluteus cervinus TaxID=181527 RepID=A0ACD3A4T2_9AGAR|nr:Dyp-type peroxidase [Pluteus cervinus]
MRVLPLLDEPQFDLKNIQGDILSGLPRNEQTNYYFTISDSTLFKQHMKEFIPSITTALNVKEDRKTIEDYKVKRQARLLAGHSDPKLIKNVSVNVAFSKFGHEALGIDNRDLGDNAFALGQAADAIAKGTDDGKGLGDPETLNSSGERVPRWDPEFLQRIDGFFLVTGDSDKTIQEKIGDIQSAFGVGSATPSIKHVHSISGKSLDGKIEHFGYKDDISNPAVKGFHDVVSLPPGPHAVNPGVILLGHPGDPNKSRNQGWTKDGSFLAFRYLHQLVPEFHRFLKDNVIAIQETGWKNEDLVNQLSARMFGRWKSGAPIDIVPFVDSKEVAEDQDLVNNFRFGLEQDVQKLCPFASHIRKVMPRDDRSAKVVDRSRIMRRGIPFGKTVTADEEANERSDPQTPRGMIFHCYQSSIEWGFRLVQIAWANNLDFPRPNSGLDPIIGQRKDVKERKMSGINPNDASVELEFPDQWVVPRGGEYFFVPSIEGLKQKYAAV